MSEKLKESLTLTFGDKALKFVADTIDIVLNTIIDNLMFISIILATFFTLSYCIWVFKNPDNKKMLKWATRTHSGYGNLIFAIASILWASSVSVFGTDLKDQWFGNDKIGIESLIFVLSVLVAITIGVLHYLYQQLTDKDRESRPSIDALNESSVRTQRLWAGMTGCMKDMHWLLHKKRFKKINKKEAENLERSIDSAIKSTMGSIIVVLKCWSKEHSNNTEFKANFFNLVPSESVKSAFNADFDKEFERDGRFRFTANAVLGSPFFLFGTNLQSRLERCDYLLVCEQTLSCTLASNNTPIHSSNVDHNPLCMPFSNSKTSRCGGPTHPNLFGAPQSLENKRLVYLTDVRKNLTSEIDSLSKSAVYSAHLTEQFKKELLNFYENDKDNPGSILSIPIYKYNLESLPELSVNPERVAGVFNIYANSSNILQNEKSAQAFYTLIKPLCYILSILISLRVKFMQTIDPVVDKESNKGDFLQDSTSVQQETSEVENE